MRTRYSALSNSWSLILVPRTTMLLASATDSNLKVVRRRLKPELKITTMRMLNKSGPTRPDQSDPYAGQKDRGSGG